MTLSTLTNRVEYPGAGTTGPFAVPFRFFAYADLRVVKRTSAGGETVLAYPTHFTATGAGNAAGTVTLATALAVGETLSIRRVRSPLQETSLRNQSAYYPADIEDTFDKLAMVLQSQQDQIDRSIRINESFDPAGFDLQIPPGETGKALVWQSSSQLGNSTIASTDSVALPGESRTVATLTAYLLNNAVYNVRDYGTTGGGVADDRAAIVAAAGAAAAGNGALLFPPGTYRIASNLTLAVPCIFSPGGKLGIDTGVTVTISGALESPGPRRIFVIAGTGRVVFGAGAVSAVLPEWFGCVADGVTDNSTPLGKAIDSLLGTNGVGGDIQFGVGAYRVDSQILLPNDGGGTPKQKALRIFGRGMSASGRGAAPNGGTQLDLRYAGAEGKIETRGEGFLEIAGLTIKDDGITSAPFLYTTNTTIHVHNNEFHGNPSKGGVTCDQDAIILGGTGTMADGTHNSSFQGYGTVIRDNYFNRIRRAVYGRTYANAVQVVDNTVWNACGSNLAGGACIEFVGLPANSCGGNIIANNLIEVGTYVYGIKLDYALHNNIINNGFYDYTATTVAFVRCEANAILNYIVDGFHDDSKLGLSETGASVGTNTRITGHQNIASQIPQPWTFSNTVKIKNGGTGALIEDAGGNQYYFKTFSTGAVTLMYKPSGGAEEAVCTFNRSAANERQIDLLGSALARIRATEGHLTLDTDDAATEVIVGQTGRVRHKSAYLGFYDTPPITKPAALTAANGSALNTGDATSDTVIGNMRTRIGELEAKLQALGLIS